jgi:bacterioferritin-associated ferredoxin
MPSRRLPSWLVEEYLAVLFGSEDMDSEERQREAMEHHAELNFRLNGGSKCGICRSHVRHVVQITVRKGRDIQNYRCLCTRCLEGERAAADMVALSLGRAVITYQPRGRMTAARRWDEPRRTSKGDAKRLAAVKT